MDGLTWLDACFMQKVLREADNNDTIVVSGIIVEPATDKGDNYASDMHRVIVRLSRIHNGDEITEARSIIAKVPPRGGAWNEMVAASGIFNTEMSMMVEILPIMNEMVADIGVASLAARCLKAHSHNPTYLMIEDLAPRGFRMAERRAGLDLDHCLIAIRNIAVYHAASVALAEKDSKAMAKYEREADVQASLFPEFVKRSTKSLGEEVANWPELSPRISEKILKLSLVIWEKECEAALLLPYDFNVLNHGDCTLSNMLFRYNSERIPIVQIFVDFQLSRYGSPAIDILTFFGTSPSVEVRLNDRELLVREYHDSLTKTMIKLKCATKTPSLDELRDILRRRAFCEVYPSFTTLAQVLVDRNEVRDLDALMMANERHEHPAYQGKIYREIMTRVLPFYDSMGLLDA